MTHEESRYILCIYFSGIYEVSIYSFCPCTTHCSCNLIQLHIPSSWIKLPRTVHHRAHGNLLFFLPSFSGFLTFLTLLCQHIYHQSCCVLWLLPSPFPPVSQSFQAFPIFSVSLQWLFREFYLEPLMFSFPSSRTQFFIPLRAPFPAQPYGSALSVWLPRPSHTTGSSCPGLPQSPAPASNRVPKNPAKTTQNLSKIHPDSEGKKIRPSQGSLSEGSLILNK